MTKKTAKPNKAAFKQAPTGASKSTKRASLRFLEFANGLRALQTALKKRRKQVAKASARLSKSTSPDVRLILSELDRLTNNPHLKKH